MDPNTYKQRKEQFVSDLSGTTMLEIAALSALFPAFVLLCKWRHSLFKAELECPDQSCIMKMQQNKGTMRHWSSYLWNLMLDFMLVVIPTLSAVTILADKVYLLTAVILCGVALVFLMVRKQSEAPSGPLDDKKQAKSSHLQYISSYRFVVMLVTCLSILAVDFNIFPRRYAKTETYGTGLMDVGVGSFVVANALVSKQARNLPPGKGNGHAFRNTGPLLLMGFARLYFTTRVDYQVHVGEYGVHWNFFFTLAAVALLTNLIHIPAHLCGIFGASILFGYQLILLGGLNSYLNSAQRGASLFSQNKEGIFSLLGYWGLYLLGVQLGHYIFKPRKFLKEKISSHRSMSWLGAAEIWILAAFFWVFTILSDRFLERVSRRMCNLAYVLFTLAINLEGLGVLVLSELIPRGKQLLLEEIFTENMLATFLLANVLTGLVNLNVDTIFAPAGVAYGILLLYLLVLVAGMGLLKALNLKIKL